MAYLLKYRSLEYLTKGVAQGACGGFVTRRATVSWDTSLQSAEYGQSPLRGVTVIDTFWEERFPFVAVWASSDLSLFTPISAPIGYGNELVSRSSSRLLTPTSSTNGSALAIHRSSQAAHSTRQLSIGAQTGLGVAIALVGIAMLALAAWLLRRRRLARLRKHEERPDEPDTEADLQSEDLKQTVFRIDSVELGPDGEQLEAPESGKAEIPDSSRTEMPEAGVSEVSDGEMKELSGAGQLWEAAADETHELQGDFKAVEVSNATRVPADEYESDLAKQHQP